jgi:4-alpha-glucanotransferase
VNRNRKSGILLHVTSLPSAQGVGSLGPEARHFIDWLARAKQSYWQVLPLAPTGFGDSPYQAYSAFAGNPLLVSLEQLENEGLLEPDSLKVAATLDADRVEFEHVVPIHRRLMGRAFDRFREEATGEQRQEFEAFVASNKGWLDDYVLFQAVKGAHSGVAWTVWEEPIRKREPAAVERYRTELAPEIDFERFVQFQFHRQWTALRLYAHERGVELIGDISIFVAHDSADVWANQQLFALNDDGSAAVVAGVPPDYFSETGQLWGNPLYRWDRMAETGYAWWVDRFRHAIATFDLLRLDHFRGFESYWEVPGDAPTAASGRWVRGPGAGMFHEAEKQFGKLPLIAEDLGVITAEVDALREELGYPGMRVLQFGFGNDPKATDYQPHNFVKDCVVYTGTHDNDTIVGWFRSEVGEGSTRTAEEIEAERAFTLRYLCTDGREIHWDMIRLALASVSKTAIFPLQDVLGLGSAARMNLPGTSTENWRWRFQWEALTPEIERRLATLTQTYERLPSHQPPVDAENAERGGHTHAN